ncbi:MAG: hypothetical protein K2O67_03200, partial [Clostridia bacterium]|nr:hypothetical protein [Clostridia bacterium]
RYLISKKLMDEPVHLSELFEFFDKDTPEYDELARILEYSEGDGLNGGVSEKYFNDCLILLRLNKIDKEIEEQTKLLDGASDLKTRAAIAQNIVELNKRKQKIKNGTNN